MFARRSRILGVLAGLGDVAIVALAFQIAFLVRLLLPTTKPFRTAEITWQLQASALIIWWIAGLMVGAHRRAAVHDFTRIVADTLKHAAVAGIAFMSWIYLLKWEDVSRIFIVVFGLVTPVLLLLYRLAGRRLQTLLRQDLDGQVHYVIVGTNPQAIQMAVMVESGEDLGNRIVAFLQDQSAAAARPADGLFRPADGLFRPADSLFRPADGLFRHDALRRAYPLRDLASLPAMLEDHVVDEVIFAVDKQELEQMEELFLSCEEEGVKTRVLVNLFPRLHADVYLEKMQSVPLLTFGGTPENEYLLFLKRVFDVLFSALLLVVLSPFFLLVAILVKLTSAGPIFYSQIRCGLNGRRFRLYKFRSMRQDAEQRRAEVQHLNESDGPVFKSSRDPRITPLGRHLRRLSIDEWPQLLNILKGEMSFVGPRPPIPEEVERYERWQRRRLRMKPGLTCLWALEGRSELDFRSWMRLDLDYIEQWSLLLDFKILFRTIPRVLSGRGAS
jgi:lipopolysaccharide/colanic/teichoic acid biosynthesis glycosyltransferase